MVTNRVIGTETKSLEMHVFFKYVIYMKSTAYVFHTLHGFQI